MAGFILTLWDQRRSIGFQGSGIQTKRTGRESVGNPGVNQDFSSRVKPNQGQGLGKNPPLVRGRSRAA